LKKNIITFTMVDYRIWCTYHDKKLLDEYNLKESEHFKLYYNDDRNLKEENINYLHDYLGEMTTYYYVWKNQIKSDYVGFCQYRRHFMYINFEELEKHKILALCNWPVNDTIYTEHCGKNKIINDFYLLSFINYMYNKYNINAYDNIFIQKNHKIGYHSAFIYQWDIFNEVCEFIFGFLDYLTLGKWKDEQEIIHLSKMYHFHTNEDEIYNYYWPRAYGVLNELFIGMFINIKYNDIAVSWLKYYIALDEVKINNLEQFERWYKMNIKTGIIYFYIDKSVRINEDIKRIIFNERRKDFLYIVTEKPDLKEIKLKINERVNCLNSIDMHNNEKYTIEKFI